jgi:hypothetical protein
VSEVRQKGPECAPGADPGADLEPRGKAARISSRFERLHRLTTRLVAAVVSSWPARYLSPGREERRTSPHANAARDRPVADLKQT